MYKVFFNDSKILIGSEMKKSLNDNINEVFDVYDEGVVSQVINRIECSADSLSFSFNCINCYETWKRFRACFTEIAAAGGVIVNNHNEILFIKRFGYWDLPKGKIEEGETAEEASAREVQEECGISNLHIIRPLDSTFHIYRSPFLPLDNNLVLKETKWFLMKYAGNEVPVPQVEEDIVEIRWFNMADLDDVYGNIYSNLREFLQNSLLAI